MKTCRYCDAVLTSARQIQCGEPECRRSYNNDRMRAYQRKWKEESGERYEYRFRNPKYPARCVVCGTSWITRKTNVKYCCRLCYRFGITGSWPSVRLPADHPARVAYPATRVFGNSCDVCQRWFYTPYETKSTCSARCKAAKERERFHNKAQRRRARKREAHTVLFARRDIFERDSWICQLCGVPVDRLVRAPAPYAPTIDHIIPLARGGTHEPDNVQTAHFICNSRKGARLDVVRLSVALDLDTTATEPSRRKVPRVGGPTVRATRRTRAGCPAPVCSRSPGSRCTECCWSAAVPARRRSARSPRPRSAGRS